MTPTPRPEFSRSEISPKHHWILEEIEDVNADAMDAQCYSCKAELSWAQWLNASDFRLGILCHRCDSLVFSDGSSNPVPRATALQLEDPSYFDRLWYHTSSEKDWAKIVRKAEGGELIVHAGSRLAALSRADDLYEESKEPTYYLHSFRLRSTRRFARTILDDMVEYWQTELLSPEPMDLCPVEDEPTVDGEMLELGPDGYHGAPYYNRYELPGDISILFHAKLIQLNTVETVELYR